MEWVNIKDKLPPFEETINTLWFDVWIELGARIPDVKFREDGKFCKQILDYDGDYSHDEEISNITHWMEVEPPK